jgi:hypothetical protein
VRALRLWCGCERTHAAEAFLCSNYLQRKKTGYNVLLMPSMKEKELRERIEQFLRKTARNVVVPASMGLGLSVSGCDQHTLHAKAADAGGDSAAQVSDVAKVLISDVPPAAPEVRDATSPSDLPFIAMPYLVWFPPDAGAPDQPRDGESEAGTQGPDAAVDAYVPIPPLIYVFYMQRAETDAAAPSDAAATPSASPEKA